MYILCQMNIIFVKIINILKILNILIFKYLNIKNYLSMIKLNYSNIYWNSLMWKKFSITILMQ